MKLHAIGNLWAKLDILGEKNKIFHPLILHMIDVAACARSILLREPETTRKRMADCIGLPWDEVLPWLLLLVACHDIGKACPGFQLKYDNGRELLRKAGLNIPKLPDTKIKHNFVSQIALESLLGETGWSEDLATLSADAVGCHHGIRATPRDLEYFRGNRNGVDERNYKSCWKEIFNLVKETVGAKKLPAKKSLSGPDFMLISGLSSFSDWIGSNEDYFPFGTTEDCIDPVKWFNQSCEKAERALDAIGWNKRTVLSEDYRSFANVFPQCLPPRPLQEAIAEAVSKISSPCVILIEAPMGEGKTEAAFYAHLELQRRFGHRGMYMALPTKATGNAMFKRALSFLHSFSDKRKIDLQLVHGAVYLNDTFQKLRLEQIYAEEENGFVRAGEWFTNKKRALLSEYGVGTIDQALLTILPVRHYFVRLWGLANRVVIFDEIHAYDAYTGKLLFHLIRWLRALGSSVILLSATLPPEFRRRLSKELGAKIPEQEKAYPRLTIFEDKEYRQLSFAANRRQAVSVEQISSSLEEIKLRAMDKLPDSGYAGIIVNTVQRAQELYDLFGKGEMIESDGIVIGKRLSDGTEIHLFHARYPAQERQKREDSVLSIYGKIEDEDGNLKERFGRHILIATQVAEQSLDLDFDMMVTDLAPIDLVLQRAGRLWRHQRKKRPVDQPLLCVAGLAGESIGSFGSPLWWSKVYREDILIRTWEVLKMEENNKILLPDDIETLVKEVYDGIAMPADEEIISRLEKAEIESDGTILAQQTMAHQAIIGLPDDGSWKDASRLYLYDNEEPGVHHTLMAKTRLGEDSIIAIPIFPGDNFDAVVEPDISIAKVLFLHGISVSRKNIVNYLRKTGVPAGWKKSALLRNCYPLILDNNNRWMADGNIRLDKELGLMYEKEAQ